MTWCGRLCLLTSKHCQKNASLILLGYKKHSVRMLQLFRTPRVHRFESRSALLSKSTDKILPAMARVVPSGRDLRKYARLFLRTDQDSDGYISAEEVRDVFNKSYLPPDVLIHIFNQANVSQSPHLSFPEFVAAMHLIREARHTQQPASISAELMNFLSNFYESPWDLATQGSSKSAQAMKQSAHSTYQAQAACRKQEI